MIRGIVKSVVEGVIKRFSATGRVDENIDNREYFQHYGYTSRPKPGAEIIIIREGNHIIAIASDDRRYRLSLAEGECALYDDQGQKVHLKAGGLIEILGNTKITATAPTVEVVASVKVTMTTPLLEVSGNIVAGGNVGDQGGTKTMAGMRTVFNAHTHTHPADGVPIPAPATGM
jgi:phage gp45-like